MKHEINEETCFVSQVDAVNGKWKWLMRFKVNFYDTTNIIKSLEGKKVRTKILIELWKFNARSFLLPFYRASSINDVSLSGLIIAGLNFSTFPSLMNVKLLQTRVNFLVIILWDRFVLLTPITSRNSGVEKHFACDRKPFFSAKHSTCAFLTCCQWLELLFG